MFSKETIKIRRPYDKNATSAPRRASFFGSTNKAEFLTDETGSVRWLCFELTGKINWDYKKDLNIDDIWRQAYSLYQNGFKYELTPDEIHENEIANRQYQVTTPELELIQKNYAPGSKEQHDAFYQATDFLNNLTEKCPTARLNLNNIGKALKIFGFERTSKRTDKYPIKGYFIKFSEIQN
jgi:predicted P-loop ATPase